MTIWSFRRLHHELSWPRYTHQSTFNAFCVACMLCMRTLAACCTCTSYTTLCLSSKPYPAISCCAGTVYGSRLRIVHAFSALGAREPVITEPQRMCAKQCFACRQECEDHEQGGHQRGHTCRQGHLHPLRHCGAGQGHRHPRWHSHLSQIMQMMPAPILLVRQCDRA